MVNRILIVAGEASGDRLGGDLARELRRQRPDLKLMGMGGDEMRQAGVDIIVDNHALDIIGWWGVVRNFSAVRRAMEKIKHEIQKKPDLLILIDYPGFNLRMAKAAKKAGVQVLYYVSPQIWAWRYNRIKTIKSCVNHIAVLFPFEVDIYQKENIPVTYVGHPLSIRIGAKQTPQSIYTQYHLNPQEKIIALFPGSRPQEIHRLLPVMLEAVRLIRNTFPHAQFVLPLALSLRLSHLKSYLKDEDKIVIIENNTENILSVCDAAIVKSGTSTLEVALSGVPLVIIYKGNWLNYAIARFVVKVRQIGLCNIVAQEKIAQEFIQGAANAKAIAKETLRLLMDRPYRDEILRRLSRLRSDMSPKETANEVAHIVFQFLN